MSELAEPNLCNNQNTSEWPGFENRWEHRLIDLSNPQGNKCIQEINRTLPWHLVYPSAPMLIRRKTRVHFVQFPERSTPLAESELPFLKVKQVYTLITQILFHKRLRWETVSV